MKKKYLQVKQASVDLELENTLPFVLGKPLFSTKAFVPYTYPITHNYKSHSSTRRWTHVIYVLVLCVWLPDPVKVSSHH